MQRPLEGLRFGEHLQWYGDDAIERAAPRPRTAALPSSAVDRTTDADGLAWRITRAFVRGDLDLSTRVGAPIVGWEGMPEVRAAHRVRALGANDAEIRVFMTLISAMDRARDADRLWDRGAGAFASAPWLFDPAGGAATQLHRAARRA